MAKKPSCLRAAEEAKEFSYDVSPAAECLAV